MSAPQTNRPPIPRAAVREAIIQALADALVASWRRDHPEVGLHSRAS